MATSKGFNQFSRRMGIFAKKIDQNAERAIRRAAVAADQAAVLSTPVDTGRARGNWLVSLQAPLPALPPEQIRSVAETLEQGRSAVSQWTLDRGGSIFIANSVPYIIPLEQGSSRQAPRGMSKFAIAAAIAQLRGFKLLRETRGD